MGVTFPNKKLNNPATKSGNPRKGSTALCLVGQDRDGGMNNLSFLHMLDKQQ